MAGLNLELTPSALLYNLRSYFRLQYPKLSPSNKILVAYSGGLDSHVLLHLLSCIPRDEFDLRAIYINHGLQSQAVDWGKHCQQVCQDLDVPFSSINVSIKPSKGESLEELARTARYQALYAALKQDEILMTAHHQNDQAETLLLQLFRGAGVHGLAAMANTNEIKVNSNTYLHSRPLLHQSRQALEAYVRENDLKHIEDPSNQDTGFDRNFLRQKIMPLLRDRWLGIDKAISRTATLQAETKGLLDEVAQQDLPSILASELSIFTGGNDQPLLFAPIAIPRLLKLSDAKQRLLIRYWVSKQGFLNPSAKKLQHIFTDVIESAKDKQPLVEWKGAELRRFQDHLYIMSPLLAHDVTQVISWQADSPLNIPSINITLNPDLLDTDSENITVRFRQGGETIEIPKRGNISLKNLFQEQQIPPWVRSRLPLIYIDDKLIKIVGLDELK
ncbi:MAG: tRNA lysidine(34) synthetase TilS [Cocleimonas sp.]